MTNIHKYVKGIPKLQGNSFYKCPSCLAGKISKRSITFQSPEKSLINTMQTKIDSTMHIGQHWSMDFGFMRGSAYKRKSQSGHTITSIDGYNSYLLTIERKTRFIWVFLSASKTPPVDIVKTLLNKFKSNHPHRTVRTDQGGELGKSSLFKTMIQQTGFHLELTGSDASAQNGLAENPNKSLAQMVRCMLFSAELGPEYCSFCLIHAVYIKNCIIHFDLSIKVKDNQQ